MSDETSWVRPEALQRLRERAGRNIEDAAAQAVRLRLAGFSPVTPMA